jgi:hypothetical protein
MSATNFYQQAETHAMKANELAIDAREKLSEYSEIKKTIDRWDEIMSNTYPVVWAIFFIIISVVEFLFSIDLYVDLLPFTPWIIPIGIIVISVFISHALATKFMPSLKNKEFSDKRHSKFYGEKTDKEIWIEVKNSSNRNAILGIIAAISITFFIYWLSNERVMREMAAGIRNTPFGVYDLLPVVFYIFEIIAGVLVLYLIKRTSKGLKAKWLKSNFDGLVRHVADETKNAVKNFELAEEKGLNLLHHTISESIHIAFYRNKNCNPSDEENYIREPQNTPIFVKFKILRAEKSKPLTGSVHIHTEYNYAATGVTDDTGIVEIPFTSFTNDTIKKLIVEFIDGTNSEDSVIYQTGNQTPHTVLFRE